MLTQEMTDKLKQLAAPMDEDILTEEILNAAIESVNTLLLTNNLVIEAEDLESYSAGVQDVLENYELSDFDRAQIEEGLGTILKGIAKGAGRAYGTAVGAAGKVAGAYQKTKSAVKGAIKTVKHGARTLGQAWKSGVHAAGGSMPHLAAAAKTGSFHSQKPSKSNSKKPFSLTRSVFNKNKQAAMAKKPKAAPAVAAAPAAAAAPAVAASNPAKPKTPAQAAANKKKLLRRATKRAAAQKPAPAAP